MNTLLFDHSEIIDTDCLQLSDHRAEHIQKVLGLKAGDELKVGLIDGQLGTAKVVEINEKSVRLQFELSIEPPAAPSLKVLLALPRPKVLGRKLKSLAELGVKDIHLINASKVESSYWTAHQLREGNIRRHLLSGLSQSNDTVLPRVHFEKGFRPFVEDRLPDLVKGCDAWVAHPYAQNEIVGSRAPSVLAIGPEGGWVDFELELLKSVGFQLGNIGSRVLSTETAIVALVSRLT